MVNWQDQSLSEFNDGSRKRSRKKYVALALILFVFGFLMWNSLTYVSVGPWNGCGTSCSAWRCDGSGTQRILCFGATSARPGTYNMTSIPSGNNTSHGSLVIILNALHANQTKSILQFDVAASSVNITLTQIQIEDITTSSTVIVNCTNTSPLASNNCSVPIRSFTFALNLPAFNFNKVDTYQITFTFAVNGNQFPSPSIYNYVFK